MDARISATLDLCHRSAALHDAALLLYYRSDTPGAAAVHEADMLRLADQITEAAAQFRAALETVEPVEVAA